MTMEDKKSNVYTIEYLAKVLVQNNLSEVEYEEDGKRIYLSRNPVVEKSCEAQIISPSTIQEKQIEKPVVVPDLKDHPGTIRAPMVGTVYTASEPGAAPFVRVGDSVMPGQTLLIIEAMKVLNPIKASKAGKVVEIFVFDQKPVEYDEPLLTIE